MHLSKILLILLLWFSAPAISQVAGLKKSIPAFDIELTNTTHFKPADLKKNIPLMLVYFSPDCEHCRDFLKSVLGRISDFGNTQIVLISYLPITDIAKFETEFNLVKYPNIITGTEGYTFLVQKYYNVLRFPFTALFNTKGQLTAAYRTAPAPDEIIGQLKK